MTSHLRLRLALFAWVRLAFALVAALLAAQGHAVEIRHWARLPLPVSLFVDQERVVFIDRNVRVGVPASLADRLRVQSAGGAIYLRASGPFEAGRIKIQDADNGALILLDVTATPAKDGQTSLEPLRIVENSSATVEGASSNAPQADSKASVATPVPVVLTRYAAQSLYAPLRTIEPVAGISPVNVRMALPLDTLMPSAPLRASVMAAWRLDDQWVTAVRITNQSKAWLSLDPRLLQGDFVAASFQHPDVGPTGTPSDTTVLYLVTRGHGLAESLLPRISRIDAAQNLPGIDQAASASGGHHEE
jgi:integrating conjugative element protein (TIGR03749 family)